MRDIPYSANHLLYVSHGLLAGLGRSDRLPSSQWRGGPGGRGAGYFRAFRADHRLFKTKRHRTTGTRTTVKLTAMVRAREIDSPW